MNSPATSVPRSGLALIDPGGSVEVANAVATLPDGSILVAGHARTPGSDFIDFCLARLRPDGTIDTAFGDEGILLLPFVPGSDDLGRSLVVLPDQRVVIAGNSYDPSSGGYDFTLIALNAEGLPVSGFGQGGKARASVGAETSDLLRTVLVQADGLLLVGDSNNPGTGTQDFSVVRLSTSGAVDSAFGDAGAALLASSGTWESAGGAVLQPDGRLLIAGSRSAGSSYDLAITRLEADGDLDPTFGEAGSLTIDVAGGSGDRGGAVALQPDAQRTDPWILLAGTSYDSVRRTTSFSVVRLDAAGSLDAGGSGFGTGGKTLVPMGSGSVNLAGIAVQPQDGRILVVGDRYVASSDSRDFCVVRLNADGSLDTGFGDNGIALVSIPGSDDYARGFTLQDDGSLLIVGNSSGGATDGLRIVKLTSDGRLDGTFGEPLPLVPLVGTDTGERLEGGAGNDTVSGLGGNDTLAGFGGDDLLDGGAGIDTAVFSGTLAGYTLARTGGTLVVADLTPGRDGTDTGTSLERLQFADMGVNLTVQATATSIPLTMLDRICELYVGFFGRVPAADGLENWVRQWDDGKWIDRIADDFYGIGSSAALRQYTGYWDFANDRELSGQDYVRIVYRNVLGREGLDAGIDYWASRLGGPDRLTRGELVSTMLDAAHELKPDPDWGWVADLLDDRIAMSKLVAMQWGLNYASTAQGAIEKGMRIAGTVVESPNPNPLYKDIPLKTFDFDAAVELVGIDPAAIDLV